MCKENLSITAEAIAHAMENLINNNVVAAPTTIALPYSRFVAVRVDLSRYKTKNWKYRHYKKALDKQIRLEELMEKTRKECELQLSKDLNLPLKFVKF